MKILILENDEYFMNKLYEIILEYQFQNDLDFEVSRCKNYQEYLSNREKTNLFFLDIELDNLNGMTIAKEISEYQPKSIIVYITAHKRYMPNAFGLNIYRFIEKNHLEEINSVLAFCVEYFDHSGIGINSLNGELFIQYQDIYYIESYYRKTYLHTKDDIIQIYWRSIGSFLENLPNQFILINQHTIVNLDRISFISKEKIKLKGLCDELYISRRKFRYVKEEYLKRLKRWI